MTKYKIEKEPKGDYVFWLESIRKKKKGKRRRYIQPLHTHTERERKRDP
jgi:hypothetical protein